MTIGVVHRSKAVAETRLDLILFCTHPYERSAWLRQDVVTQARATYRVPVRHIVSHTSEALAV